MARKKRGKGNKKNIIIEDERCFGQYKCSNCNRTWMSGNSWDKYGQKCYTCQESFVLPHNQRPLDKPGGFNRCNPNKSHPRELCQKCIALGHYCGKEKK